MTETLKKSGFKNANAATEFTPKNATVKSLYDLEIEQCLLGSLLNNNLAYEEVFDVVKAEYFYAEIHRRIFAEIGSQITQAKKATAISVFPFFENDESLKEVGGAKEYIAGLLSCGFPFSALSYAEYIRDTWMRRSIIEYAENLTNSMKGNSPIWEPIAQFQETVSSMVEYKGAALTSSSSDWDSTKKYIEAVMNGQIQMTSTGYPDLDNVINGLQRGSVYVLAGSTGMGKTALALNMAENIANTGEVLYFSFEMPKSQLYMRMAARKTGISISRQLKGQLNSDEAIKLFSIKMPAGMIVYDRSGADIQKIVNICRKFVRKFPNAKAIFIDYLGLIAGNPKLQKVHQIEEITKIIKQAAIALDMPIVLISQLSRSLSARDDKRPLLSDLRDSGAIEQDADCVIFVYRPEYYLSRPVDAKRAGETDEKYRDRAYEHQKAYEESRGKAEIIIAKNRHGELQSVEMTFNGKNQEFSSIENKQNSFMGIA